ncbi:glutathione S-transferase theta-2-like [Choloepus didactylus]|uniref:glutathione S-transferase theta-2-like n=1 Tax=Choloepus didactylus TaxID=27675 RepID=UPI00189F4FEE|nr:glutathione S-transferase theta-2-like [Choloepus didactylus]
MGGIWEGTVQGGEWRRCPGDGGKARGESMKCTGPGAALGDRGSCGSQRPRARGLTTSAPALPTSVAILIYLSNKYQAEAHWYPPDPQARTRVHEYLGWHADCIRSVFGVPLWTQVLAPLIGNQVPKDKVERNRDFMDWALRQLEDEFLKDNAFLTGQQVTLANLMALEELMQPVALGYNLFEGRPQLAAWRE